MGMIVGWSIAICGLLVFILGATQGECIVWLNTKLSRWPKVGSRWSIRDEVGALRYFRVDHIWPDGMITYTIEGPAREQHFRSMSRWQQDVKAGRIRACN